jgi:hypothetical protein
VIGTNIIVFRYMGANGQNITLQVPIFVFFWFITTHRRLQFMCRYFLFWNTNIHQTLLTPHFRTTTLNKMNFLKNRNRWLMWSTRSWNLTHLKEHQITQIWVTGIKSVCVSK